LQQRPAVRVRHGAILAEIRRCLKPDGVAMVDVDVQIARTTPAARLRAAAFYG
jgi:hypothetical protein